MTPRKYASFTTPLHFSRFVFIWRTAKSVDVPHPDFMHLSPTGRRLIVDQMDDSFEIIDVLRDHQSRDFTQERQPDPPQTSLDFAPEFFLQFA